MKIELFSENVHKYNYVYKIKVLNKTIWPVEMCFIRDHQLLSRLPVQEVPSPVNPLLHLQVYKLIPSIHSAFLSQRLEIHSSISKIFIKINLLSEVYLNVRISEIHTQPMGHTSPRSLFE